MTTLVYISKSPWAGYVEETYKLPRRKMNIIDSLDLVVRRRPRITLTGKNKIKVSITTSTTPVTIQKKLKLMQCSAGARLVCQLISIGIQPARVAIVVASQKAATIPRTTSD